LTDGGRWIRVCVDDFDKLHILQQRQKLAAELKMPVVKVGLFLTPGWFGLTVSK